VCRGGACARSDLDLGRVCGAVVLPARAMGGAPRRDQPSRAHLAVRLLARYLVASAWRATINRRRSPSLTPVRENRRASRSRSSFVSEALTALWRVGRGNPKALPAAVKPAPKYDPESEFQPQWRCKVRLPLLPTIRRAMSSRRCARSAPIRSSKVAGLTLGLLSKRARPR